ncbi:MAG: hypothetical protein BWY70_01212 [Bacteroidetes bacterium ADurb.Bin408]|nr:MAG: hypothetical protein BWY70_01212 [Bacteroidetes bacterium ADurb.Bin408]
MPEIKKIIITESVKDLKKRLKTCEPIYIPRLRMLIISKMFESGGISKRALADRLGVNPNSVQAWRRTYAKGGLNALLSHNKKGFKKTIFTEREIDFMKKSICVNLKHGKYKKITSEMEAFFHKSYKYTTVLNYIKTHLK